MRDVLEKNGRLLLGIFSIIALLLCGCANQNISGGAEEYQYSDPAKLLTADAEQREISLPVPNVSKAESPYVVQSKELINNAFFVEILENSPIISTDGDWATVRYEVSDDEAFVVEFQKDLPYPAALYHFCHAGDDPEFDLAQESSDYFQDGMIPAAMEFVQKMYDVDCTNAEVHAYGYKNKISVQMEIAPDQIFHVRFYYTDLDPVGVLFSDSIDSFNRAMEINQAKMYF